MEATYKYGNRTGDGSLGKSFFPSGLVIGSGRAVERNRVLGDGVVEVSMEGRVWGQRVPFSEGEFDLFCYRFRA